MQVSDVKVFKVDGSKNVRAMVSVTFDECFVVTGFRVVDSAKGLFVSPQSQKGKEKDEDGKEKYYDLCYPITAEFREYLYETILNAYLDTLKGNKKS